MASAWQTKTFSKEMDNIMNIDRDKFEEIFLNISQSNGRLIRSMRDTNIIEHNIKGSFPFIPYHGRDDLFVMFNGLQEAIGKTAPTFLDVGCGTGWIVKLAKELGFNAMGVEIYKPYVELGRMEFNLTENEVVCMDAFAITPEFLMSVDVIYTYMPLSDPNLMSKLHLDLYLKAHLPTLFIEMLPHYYPLNKMKMEEYLTKVFPGDYYGLFAMIKGLRYYVQPDLH